MFYMAEHPCQKPEELSGEPQQLERAHSFAHGCLSFFFVRPMNIEWQAAKHASSTHLYILASKLCYPYLWAYLSTGGSNSYDKSHYRYHEFQLKIQLIRSMLLPPTDK